MHRRAFLSQWIRWGLLGGTLSSLCGCGTIFHGERVRQPHSRDIDWAVVALDGLGLVLFFVPGVIAFAVDFYTGAIYLPPESMEMPPVAQDPEPVQPSEFAGQTTWELQQSGAAVPSADRRRSSEWPAIRGQSPGTLRRLDIAAAELSPRSIEHVVAQHIGRRFDLADSTVRVSPLQNLCQFARQCQRHHADREYGLSPRRFFELRRDPSPGGQHA